MFNKINSNLLAGQSTKRPRFTFNKANGGQVAENQPNEPKIGSKTLSEHMQKLRERHAMMREQSARMREDLENARKMAEAQAEQMRKMQIAFEIAARITRGDNVPQMDKDFLLEQSPGLFKLAMSARNHDNDDPKDHDPISKERESGEMSIQVTPTTTTVEAVKSAFS